MMELAERALDESFKVKLQAFINEVCCLTLYTHSPLRYTRHYTCMLFMCAHVIFFFSLSCICRDLRNHLRTGRYLMWVLHNMMPNHESFECLLVEDETKSCNLDASN